MNFRDSLSLITYIILDVLLGGILSQLVKDHLTRKADNLQKEINSILPLILLTKTSKPPPKRHKIKIS